MTASTPPALPRVGEPAPDFTLPSTAGGEATPVKITHVQIYYDLHLLPAAPMATAPEPEKSGFAKAFFIGADAERQPLSWHLRQCEKDDIRRRLDDLPGSQEFQTIKDFFDRKP